MSAGRGLGVGAILILLGALVRYGPTIWRVMERPVRQVARRYRAIDEADDRRHRELDVIETGLAFDRARYFERMAERANQRPQDKVQLFDSEHRLLGWGLRVGEDPRGNAVIWVPPAVHDVVASAEGSSGPIEDARFDDGGMEGPWDHETRARGRWKLPNEAGWALPPEQPEQHGRWSDET